jgi:hypothetical protein
MIFIVILIALVIFQSNKLKFVNKSSIVKKSEIIDGYKDKIKTMNNKKEKIVYLKIINQELSRNIFFDQDEIKEIMKDLTSHSFK